MTAYVRGISVSGRGGSVDSDAIHEYTVTYKIYTDDRADGPSIVESAFGIPKIGDIYISGNDLNATAVCRSKAIRQTDSPWEWEVDCTFNNQPFTIKGVTPIDNPLDQPAELSYGFQQRTVRAMGYFFDAGSPPTDKVPYDILRCSNGEPVNPQPEKEIAEPVLTIKKNVQAISGPALMGLANCVNSDYWQGAEPRQLRLGAPQAARKYAQACGFYWEVSYTLAFRWETWDFFIQNEGSYYWAGGKPDPIAAADWNNATKFKRKYKDGQIMIVNLTTNGDINATSTPTWSRYRVYRELAFSSLGLI